MFEEALGELTDTAVCVSMLTRGKSQRFIYVLRHKEEKKSLKVSWNGVDLENTTQPKYLGVIFHRTC